MKRSSSCRYAGGFGQCSALKKLDTGGVTYIDANAFKRSPINDLTLGTNCRYIGVSAFLNAELDTLKLPKNMQFAAPGSFTVKDVYVPKTMHTAEQKSDHNGRKMDTTADTFVIAMNRTSLFALMADYSAMPKIHGFKNTAVEAYANEFGFEFVDAETENIDWGGDVEPYSDAAKPDTRPSETDTDKHSDTTNPSETDNDKPSGGMYGDIDMDGSVTANDALLILRNSIGLADLTPAQKTCADIDSDGSIKANDALAVLRYSVGLSGADKIGRPVA